MHDPLTVAFNVRIPLPWKKPNTLYRDKRREWCFIDVATIWHKDPEKDGTDDSCGWFKRARHGSKTVLAAIEKRFDEDWDRTWTYDPNEDGGDAEETKRGKVTYMRGYFHTGGMPRMSAQGIMLNLFFMAANEHFKCNGSTNWKQSRRFMRKHLFDIMLFAENPTDSMFDELFLTFGKDSRREERICKFAAVIYGWILRQEQPWYRHPRWHIWHWRIQVPFLQLLHRRLFVRCCRCKKGFKWGESVIGSWSGKEIWHDGCDRREVKP